jgi:hypothetical protein
MNLILLFISFAVLFPVPILYPPIAAFTAYFWAKNGKFNLVALCLLYSTGVVNALIAATVNPYTYPLADTSVYIASFQNVRFFDLKDLVLADSNFEPLYKVYEFVLSFLIGDKSTIFLLITALIINFLSITAILRICRRLKQYQLAYLILAICYSLTPPALGLPIFLLRSSLSLSLLFLGISFYGELSILFYGLSLIAIFTHYSSSLIFGVIMLQKGWMFLMPKPLKIIEKTLLISVDRVFVTRLLLFLFMIVFTLALVAPGSTTPLVRDFLTEFSSSDNVASGKAKSFLISKVGNFVDFKNPVMILHVAITSLCFFKLSTKSIENSSENIHKTNKDLSFIELLRGIGRSLIILIAFTAPLNFLPLRLGFFNFSYFPLWLINVPFLAISQRFKKYQQYIVSFALFCVFTYCFYWIPKRDGGQYFIEVLGNRLLQHSLIEVISHYF